MTATQVNSDEKGFQFSARHFALILIVIGIFISGYLSYVKLLDAPILCVEGDQFDCGAVASSTWASVMGIPVAYAGLLGYLVMGAIFLLEDRVEFLRINGLILLFTIGLVGWLFSMWLVYVQAVVILAFCQWCLAHELNFTILFGVILYLLWQDLRE